MSPRVSLVMPAYQTDWSVGTAIESVLWQTYRDFELIVVDDGSTDATVDIASAHRGPIRIVQQEHAGVAAARNRGIAEATGELIAFCDADDILFARHLEALVSTFDARPTGFATANAYWLFPGGIHPGRTRIRGRFPPPEEQRRAILEQNFVSTMSLFPRALPDEIGPFARDGAEDWDFWLRAIFAGHTVALQPEPLALYRWSITGLSSNWRRMDAQVEAVLHDLEHHVELTEEELAYVIRRRTGPSPRELGRGGDEALRARRYRDAARQYREAAALAPSDRALVWKSRVISIAPRVAGPLVLARQRRLERRFGLDESQ
jgi:glycosyltransferase involved in cell wall biosynthesis